MSEALYINDKKLLPAKEAGSIVGYTSDYVAKLARENTVEAERIGKQWYVDLDSLKLFSLGAKKQKMERQEALREQRINERAQFENKHLTEKTTRAASDVRKLAVVEAFAVFLCVGLVSGLVFVSAREQISAGVMVDTLNEMVEKVVAQVSIEDQGIVGPNVVEVVSEPEATVQTGVVIFDGETSAESIEFVRESFSDEVDIRFEGNDMGVVTPVFREGRTPDEYRFLLVPVASGN